MQQSSASCVWTVAWTRAIDFPCPSRFTGEDRLGAGRWSAHSLIEMLKASSMSATPVSVAE